MSPRERGRWLGGPKKQNAAGDGFTSSVATAPDVDAIPEPAPCHFAGILCHALAVLELQEAGRLDLCCRHYLDADEVA